MFKKFLCCIMSVTFITLSSIGASAAKIGNVIDYTLYTDIVTTIDGYDIPSFVIGNYTYIVAEDLRSYGFDVEWDNNTRSLYITKIPGKVCKTNYIAPYIDKSLVAKPAHPILETDIKTYLNATLTNSFSINGYTLICFDELSRYGTVSYNNNSRRLNLDLFDTQGTHTAYDKVLMGDLSDYSGVYEDGEGNVINLRYDGMEIDYWCPYRGYLGEYADGFKKHPDGHYSWGIGFEMDGYAFWLYPVGVEVYSYYGHIPTDTSKVRLYAGQDFYPDEQMPSKIYYKK